MSLLTINCRSGSRLSSAEQEKLDYALRQLVVGEPLPDDRYAISQRGDSSVYSVFISTDDPESLRSSDVPVGSINGAVATARLTVHEIRRAASLEFVRTIANDAPARPNSSQR